MNAAKLERAEREITTAARKVLDCLNATTASTAGEVTGELKRRGISLDPRVVGGVLDSLKGDGLVQEVGPGRFCRVMPKPRLVNPADAAIAECVAGADADTAAAPEKADTLTSIADLAAKLRAKSADLARLADNLDSIALDVEERVTQAAAGGEKLRQLQALLRSIGGE